MGELDRGQSELVGFAIVLGIIVFAILVLLNLGFTGLDNVRDYERSTNAEQAFTIIASNIDEVTSDGAPSRSTEIRMADATLSIDGNETIRITAEPAGGGSSQVFEVETMPIVYDTSSTTRLSYSTGTLIREDAGSGVMFREPRFVLTNESVILPIIRTHSAEPIRVGGRPTIDLQLRRDGVAHRWVNESAHTVTLEVTSSRADVWFRYLDENPETACTIAGTVVTCEIETDQVSVTVYAVSIDVR